MRSYTNDKHLFQKELYSKLNSPVLISHKKSENPISHYPDRADFRSASQCTKTKMLVKSDFSDKHQGSFALSYQDFDEFRPTKKYFWKEYTDPTKPQEVIPPSNFKKPQRNPITTGDTYCDPVVKIRPDTLSRLFSVNPINIDQERVNYV